MKKKSQALKELSQQLSLIAGLGSHSAYSGEFKMWYSETETLLENLFGERHHLVQLFRSILFTPLFLSCRMNDNTFTAAYLEGLNEAEKLLRASIREIREYL